MALDASAIRCLVNEIRPIIVGCRIDKIYQPEKDEIIINIRSLSEKYRLLLSASSSNPRMHFTDHAKNNPKKAPMFCMLLRKHIGSAKITDIIQVGFDRIIKITFEAYSELGELTEFYLITEITGRNSNIIFTDADMKIIDAAKRVDITVSSVRQILPGLTYEMPPAGDRVDLLSFTPDSPLDFSIPQLCDKLLISSIAGISPLTAREIVFRAFMRTDVNTAELNLNRQSRLKSEVIHLSEEIKENKFSPCLISDSDTGRIMDFSSFAIKQYGNPVTVVPYESMSALLDKFYFLRDSRERLKQKSAGTVHILNTNIERVSKKIIILEKTLSDSENSDKYRIYGDLITANIGMIEPGTSAAVVRNYYDESMGNVKIPLDPALSASANAGRYYKKYNKAKTAKTEAALQLAAANDELAYLESTLVLTSNAETEDDINDIREELVKESYISSSRTSKKKKEAPLSPMHIVGADGFDIYIGKNNTQNDFVTTKLANSADIWFHTKNIHGSHTIIKLGKDKSVPESTILEAASYAAYYSKGRFSSQVPVDYTRIKYVRKPSGAKPGFVTYTDQKTVYVTPQKPKTDL